MRRAHRAHPALLLGTLALAACSSASPFDAQPVARSSFPTTVTHRSLADAPRAIRDELAADGVQGIAHDDDFWFVTTTHAIWRFQRGREFLPQGEGVSPFGGRYLHLGDPDLQSGILYVPLAGDRRGGPSGVGALRSDLTPIGFHPFPNVAWCAIDPRTNHLLTSSFDADRIHVMRIEVTAEHFALAFERDLVLQRHLGTRTVALGMLRSIQGGDVSSDGKLYLASDQRGVGILVFDVDTGILLERIPVDHEPYFGPLTNDEVEGVDLEELASATPNGESGRLHMLLHDEFPRRRYTLKHWGLLGVPPRPPATPPL